jgi:hypothetical protein
MESSFFFRGRWRVAFFSLYRCITEASSPGPSLVPLVAALHRSNNSRASPLRPSRQQNEPTHAHTGGVRARIAPPHEAVVPILLSPKKKKTRSDSPVRYCLSPRCVLGRRPFLSFSISRRHLNPISWSSVSRRRTPLAFPRTPATTG